MRHAAALLSQGWFRGARRWWYLTVAVLALVSSLVILVIGTFEGMEAQTDARVAAFFTGDMRVTADEPGAAPDRFFPNGTAAMEHLEAGGGEVVGRVESTFLLSRRTLIESVQEGEQYRVAVPGVSATGQDFYGVGVVVGIDMADASAVDPLRPYRVVGAFPATSAAEPGRVPLMMSIERFADTLSPEERAGMSWPPTAAEVRSLRFEITLARVDPDAPGQDVLRRPAQVVGLFQTDLDALDSFTLLAPVGHVRELLGVDSEAPVYNAITVTGGGPVAVRGQGWYREDAHTFSERYIGQVVGVVEVLGVAVAALLYTLPAILLFVGLSQVLDRHEREVAVCRAIGVPASVLQGAVWRLLARIGLLSLGVAAGLLVVGGALLATLLPGWDGSPVPLGFHVPWWAYVLTVLLVGGTAAAAAWSTIHRHATADLAQRLRSA